MTLINVQLRSLVSLFHLKLSKMLWLDGAKVEDGTGFSVIFFFQPQVEVERASSLPIRLLSLQPSPIEPAQGYSITNEINRTYWRGEGSNIIIRVTYPVKDLGFP